MVNAVLKTMESGCLKSTAGPGESSRGKCANVTPVMFWEWQIDFVLFLSVPVSAFSVAIDSGAQDVEHYVEVTLACHCWPLWDRTDNGRLAAFPCSQPSRLVLRFLFQYLCLTILCCGFFFGSLGDNSIDPSSVDLKAVLLLSSIWNWIWWCTICCDLDIDWFISQTKTSQP